jgi:hypothetical protein
LPFTLTTLQYAILLHALLFITLPLLSSPVIIRTIFFYAVATIQTFVVTIISLRQEERLQLVAWLFSFYPSFSFHPLIIFIRPTFKQQHQLWLSSSPISFIA